MPSTDQTRHMTPREVADRWQVSLRTVERIIASGQLPVLRLGPKLVRIRYDDMLAYEHSRPSE